VWEVVEEGELNDISAINIVGTILEGGEDERDGRLMSDTHAVEGENGDDATSREMKGLWYPLKGSEYHENCYCIPHSFTRRQLYY
jgi:hypothetical protein